MVEAGVYGNTLLDAATARAVERGETTTDLGRTAALVEAVLVADIERALPRLVTLLGVRAAESTDVSQMLRALPPLASTLRYGDVRRTPTGALASVVRAIAERVTVGLAPACAGLDDDAARSLAEDIVAATRALGVLVDEAHADLSDDWWAALRRVLDRRASAQVIGGVCARLLLNAERMSLEESEAHLGQALARGSEPADAARWIEGFLSPKLGGSGLVLATSARLFGLIDGWLNGLGAEYFAQVLPLLRRTTSTFSSAERRQIAERVRTGAASIMLRGTTDDVDARRAALVEPIVLAILGIER
jgi:hypothetical protein